ncbi:hypothetical protein WA1_27205 [Scytonema hofmannii PCC 7110]|uniref:CHASE2 domain-containing protein n=1 Tax=Scytonema hofmannii PCC 7110 TaxID=128403 RepID=A0A139X687_9CYAN|nr:CHASE2 domain-containing protein [Scytonema hofmannii]KYC40227.1 hypothetical protein WA1_27205 [Scytonema hofmannii PCC 7110]
MWVTFLVIFMRFSGLFEGAELWFFDNMMRLQPTGVPDNRLLVIEVTQEDIKAQGKEPRQDSSLTNKNLLEILKKLVDNPKNKPKAIGLDIYRDFENENRELSKIMSEKDNSIFAICNIGDPSQKNKGVEPPDNFSQERLGFSDFFTDQDRIVRRQVLKMANDQKPCRTKTGKQPVIHSLSLQLARHYFKDRIYKDPLDGKNSYLQIGNTVIESLFAEYRGGYSMRTDLRGYQILLKYRKPCLDRVCSLENIAPKVTVTEFLKDDFFQNYNDLKNRIVLIGVTDNSREKPWDTPFSSGGHPIPGVIIHAQMVSQILRAVEDKEALLGVWSIWHEILWIFAWSLVGGTLAQRCRTINSLTMFGGIAFLSLSVICFIIFIFPNVWIPFVPSALSFLSTGGVVLFIRLKPQKSS